MSTILYQAPKLTLELIENEGADPTYILQGVHTRVYILPGTGRYERFLAGYDGSNDVGTFLESFFRGELTDIFDALAERYPQQ
jgi:hypothetical protein